MAQTFTFTLRKIFSKALEIKGKTPAWKFWVKDKSASFVIVLGVDETTVGDFANISILAINLSPKGKLETDVFFEELLDKSYIGKTFSIQDVELNSITRDGEILMMERNDYHNIITQKKIITTKADGSFEMSYDGFLDETNTEPFNPPSDTTIENATQNQYNEIVEKYNREVNFLKKQLEGYSDMVNCTGVYYEIEREQDFNIYYNANVGGRPDLYNLTTASLLADSDEGTLKIRRKDDLKGYIREYNERSPRLKGEINKIKGWISEWRKAGNLTDLEYNKLVEGKEKEWMKVSDELNDLAKKILGKNLNDALPEADPDYKKYAEEFNQEKEKEINGFKFYTFPFSPWPLAAGNLLSEADIKSSTDEAVKRKIKTKQDWKETQRKGDELTTERQKFINLIEGRVAADKGIKVCPACNTPFTNPPISHNGIDYCSEDCKNASQTNNNYTCLQCSQVFDRTAKPPVEGYCSPECKTKANQGSKYTCAECKQEFAGTPTIKNNQNYCNDCKDKVEGDNQDQTLSQAQTKAITDIKAELNKDPKIETSELDTDFRNWESQIKGFSKVEDITSLKGQVISNITKKRTEKKNQEKFKKGAEDLKNKTGAPLREGIKKLVEEQEGTKGYNGQTVDEEIGRAWQEDPAETKNTIKEVVEAKMTKCGIKENELDAPNKTAYNKIKNKEHTDLNQLKTDKNQLLEFIGSKAVDKKIVALTHEVDQATKPAQKKIVRDKINQLKSEDNIYVEKRKADLDNLLKRLESNSNSPTTTNPSSNPWKYIIPLTLVAFIALAGLVWMVRRRQKENPETNS